MTLIERLLKLASLWSEANGRSDATLATRVAKDGKLFDRLRGGAGCTVALSERFFAFFRDPSNWPDDTMPPEVADVLDGVDLGSNHADSDTARSDAASSGKADDVSAGRVAA